MICDRALIVATTAVRNAVDQRRLAPVARVAVAVSESGVAEECTGPQAATCSRVGAHRASASTPSAVRNARACVDLAPVARIAVAVREARIAGETARAHRTRRRRICGSRAWRAARPTARNSGIGGAGRPAGVVARIAREPARSRGASRAAVRGSRAGPIARAAVLKVGLGVDATHCASCPRCTAAAAHALTLGTAFLTEWSRLQAACATRATAHRVGQVGLTSVGCVAVAVSKPGIACEPTGAADTRCGGAGSHRTRSAAHPAVNQRGTRVDAGVTTSRLSRWAGRRTTIDRGLGGVSHNVDGRGPVVAKRAR
jgi:hypothetical protein